MRNAANDAPQIVMQNKIDKTHMTDKQKRRIRVKITAVRASRYGDLIERYENPLDVECTVRVGEVFYTDGGCPDGLCPEAWRAMEPFVNELLSGGGNFFDGWMKNPRSAMVSCSDGFRPVTFYIEAED